jgi:DNA-binding transcriptional LysR family regulator
MIDWNDLRHFLAVAKAGTTLAAARELGVSQSTAARRIDALETALGLKLFDRRQSGYALTDIGRELAEAATGVEVAAAAFASKAAALRRGQTGTVRITTNDLFAGEC